MIADYFRAALTLVAVINPMICGVMLVQAERGLPNKTRIMAATKTALTVFIILMLSAIMGKYILQAFGISMNVFQIVGGLIIASIGFSMFNPHAQPDDSDKADQKSLSKLIMFAASPGTIATVITLSAVHDAAGLPVIAIVGLSIAVFLTWIFMMVMVLVSGRMKKRGQQGFTKFMGLILISMGLQFVLTGLKDFMAS